MRDLAHRIGGARSVIGRPWCGGDILFAQELQSFRVLHGEIHILRNIARLPRNLPGIQL